MQHIREIVESHLWPPMFSPFYAWRIEVSTYGNAVYVRVICDEFSTDQKIDDATKRIERAQSKILQAAGPSYASLFVAAEMDRSAIAYPIGESPAGGDAGNDKSAGNPNWPSKTGNPSGGGRGNNPPHR